MHPTVHGTTKQATPTHNQGTCNMATPPNTAPLTAALACVTSVLAPATVHPTTPQYQAWAAAQHKATKATTGNVMPWCKCCGGSHVQHAANLQAKANALAPPTSPMHAAAAAVRQGQRALLAAWYRAVPVRRR